MASGRLWFFWAQSAGVQDGRMSVWAMVTTDADSETLESSQLRRVANGVMLNKPTVLKNTKVATVVRRWTPRSGERSYVIPPRMA